MCDECDIYPYDDDSESEDLKEITLPDTTIAFIKALLDGQSGPVEHAAKYYEPVAYEEPPAPVAPPTYVVHTIWSGQEVQGFYRYIVNHNLDTTQVKVILDSNEMFKVEVNGKNQVVITSMEDLRGTDVTVKRENF